MLNKKLKTKSGFKKVYGKTASKSIFGMFVTINNKRAYYSSELCKLIRKFKTVKYSHMEDVIIIFKFYDINPVSGELYKLTKTVDQITSFGKFDKIDNKRHYGVYFPKDREFVVTL